MCVEIYNGLFCSENLQQRTWTNVVIINSRSRTYKNNCVNVVRVFNTIMNVMNHYSMIGTAVTHASGPWHVVTPCLSALLGAARRRVDVRLASYFNSLRSRHVAHGHAAGLMGGGGVAEGTAPVNLAGGWINLAPTSEQAPLWSAVANWIFKTVDWR